MDITRDKSAKEILTRLENAGPGDTVRAEGIWGSFGALLVSEIAQNTKRPILLIQQHIEDADRVTDDLTTFGAKNVELLAAWEAEEELADATDEIRAQRLRVSLQAAAGETAIYAASVQALCQPVAKPSAMKAASLKLVLESETAPEFIAKWLVENSFESVDQVDLPGQFARRGGIVDIYAPLVSNVKDGSGKGRSTGVSQAIRLEFFGDTIESIRTINLDSQRSSEEIKSIEILGAVQGSGIKEQELFSDLLPVNTIVVLDEPGGIEEVAGVYVDRAGVKGGLWKWADIAQSLSKFTRLELGRFATGGDSIRVGVKSVQHYQRAAGAIWSGHKEALEELIAEAKGGKKVLLYCEASAEITRVEEIIREIEGEIPKNFKLINGFINQGFILESIKTIVISHHELFGQFALRRRQRPIRASAAIDTLTDLNAGDYVVHVNYGIGKFLGIQTIEKDGVKGEYISLEYADDAKVHVSAANISLVQKYIGTSPTRPKLSKVGTKKWQNQRDKVGESLRDLAAELLELQANRKMIGGIQYKPDSKWQIEFEESFPYQETPDQTTAVNEIKSDMQQQVAMDRLLCGDVGYGKTELAMRAAFKAVENGKQVAVLVPTTVLCVQHARTFAERFADFPMTIEALNRFKTTKQARDILERTQAGKVDILIGTHRLLSGDVSFPDLGLLIVDEEQKFGVEHKEKLKRMRVNVDILTMTATPIPRTLHMSMLGLRDISSLGTPPLDRRSVVTNVTVYDNATIRKAILRELNRQGQVFFLHNRVKSIDRKSFELKELVPEARFAVAHGQMTKKELESAMVDFVLGRIDVLVCTTIIESGLDIPNANTILIDNADRFGLAELHQLRGRVGRYKHRAYAYMFLPPKRPVTPIAAKRLKAIEEYSHLGAGFRIALRDLEIRGAGNILGPEQSGHIQMVGYQMYCEMLSETVRRIKKEPSKAIPTCNIDIGVSIYIPKNYIPSDRHRMEAYRKISVAAAAADIEQIRGELQDVYGALPEDVTMMLELALIRIAASKLDIRSISVSGQNLVFSFSKDPGRKAADIFAHVKGNVNIADPKTVYLRMDKAYFEIPTLLAVLRKMFR